MADTASEIRIRMYRVGFGDCFLVTFPGEPPKHVLVDCGVHAAGDIQTLQAAVEDIAQETDRTLALLIASHAHEDHIAGYGRHGDEFRKFRIGEVWMPWTEDQEDPEAGSLRRKFTALYARLQAHFAARPPSAAAAAAMANLASKRNAEALANLRAGFGTGAKVRYLVAGARFRNAARITGLTARILGPPRDEEFLKKMDPPKAERYLRVGKNGAEKTENVVRPFDKACERRAGDAGPRLSKEEETALQESVKADLEGLAFVLDDVMNNSSVAVLFSYGGRNLLFPGDAQWGNWKFWIESQGGKELLASLAFYKVSHHGSQNATPRAALEQMPDGFAAMCSTQTKPWPSIPREQLWTRLTEKTARQAVRSDSLPWPGAPKGPPLAQLPKTFRTGKFWVDYFIG